MLTLQLTNDHFVIPPGTPDYRVEARGTLPNEIEPLLRVNYRFHWQMS